MKNNSKGVGKKIYLVYYNDNTKSFEIKDFDVNFVSGSGVYYIDNDDIKYEPFYHIAEYTELPVLVEKLVKTRLLDYLGEEYRLLDFLGEYSWNTAFIMPFIHRENAEEFIETHQDLLKIKDLSIYGDMINDKFKYSGIHQLTDLYKAIRPIVKNKEIYKTHSIKNFLYTYISHVVDICEALIPEKTEVSIRKNNSKEVGKKIYRVYYNDATKSFEIKDFDVALVNNGDCGGVYYIDHDHDSIKYDTFYYIAEYNDISIIEIRVKNRLLDYLLGDSRRDTEFIISFIHRENAEEFIETHQDLLKVKDLSIYHDMMDPLFKDSGLQRLAYLNKAIEYIVQNKGNYKTDSIKDFLYTYISDVVDICETLAPEKEKED